MLVGFLIAIWMRNVKERWLLIKITTIVMCNNERKSSKLQQTKSVLFIAVSLIDNNGDTWN